MARNIKLKFKRSISDRGFGFIEFNDMYDEPCRVSASSLAWPEAIWVGANSNSMHVNRKQAGQLAKILQAFSDGGFEAITKEVLK